MDTLIPLMIALATIAAQPEPEPLYELWVTDAAIWSDMTMSECYSHLINTHDTIGLSNPTAEVGCWPYDPEYYE